MFNLAHVSQRLQACIASNKGPGTSERSVLESLRTEIDTATRAHQRRGSGRPVEPIEGAVDLVYRIEQHTADCSPLASIDRALLLIGKRHEQKS
jgi:hypothetical protein